MKVYINPGHDRKYDSGAVNPNSGLRECDVAASIGAKVMKYLVGCRHFRQHSLQRLQRQRTRHGSRMLQQRQQRRHAGEGNQKSAGCITAGY